MSGPKRRVCRLGLQPPWSLRPRCPLLVRHPLLRHLLPLFLPQTVQDQEILSHQGPSVLRLFPVCPPSVLRLSSLCPLSVLCLSLVCLLSVPSMSSVCPDQGPSVCEQVRSSISDFAVFLTIMIMVLLDYLVGVPSPKLNVPDRFEVNLDQSCRVLFTLMMQEILSESCFQITVK